MKPGEHIVGKAVRIEYINKTDKTYLVFEIIDSKLKEEIKQTWIEDIEFRIVDKNLIKISEEEEK